MGCLLAALLAAASQSGPVGYWPFEGNSAADQSGNSLGGAFMGGAGTTAQAPAIPVGNQLSATLDFVAPSHQYVEVPHSSALTLTGSLTLAAWIRPTAFDNGLQAGLIEKWGSGGNINGYFLRLGGASGPDKYLQMDIGDGAAQPGAAVYNNVIPLNTWTHVAGVFDSDADTMQLYRDGQPIGMAVSVPANFTLGTNSRPLTIGRDYGSNKLNGQIDEVRIYNRALTAGEIAVLHAGQPPPSGLTATPGPNTVLLQWNPAAGATSYRIDWRLAGQTGWIPLTTTTGTSYLDTSVVFPNAYEYQVAAISVLTSTPAGPVTATPLSPIPRTNDHEEGLKDGNCACGTAGPPGVPVAALAGLLGAAALLRRRR